MYKKILNLILVSLLVVSPLGSGGSITAWGQSVSPVPVPGTMIDVSAKASLPELRGMKLYPQNAFQFDFLLEDPSSGSPDSAALKTEADRVIRYFLTALTTPEKDWWVNLSPYEQDRIIEESMSLTGFGREMLAQDYLLKQLTASLLYPDKNLGSEFWKRVYAKAYERYGTTDIPLATFHKVWIVPDVADVYENGQTNTVFIVRSHLKVMLESDYVAMQNAKTSTPSGDPADTSAVTSDVMREVVIPEIEREINEGASFASIRQVYRALILAVWFKGALKDSVMGQGFVNHGKIAGGLSKDPGMKERIYQNYLEAYRKGVFNFVREDVDVYSQESLPRKYFSGGVTATELKDVLHKVDKTAARSARSSLKAIFLVSGLALTISAGDVPAASPATPVPVAASTSAAMPAIQNMPTISRPVVTEIDRILKSLEGKPILQGPERWVGGQRDISSSIRKMLKALRNSLTGDAGIPFGDVRRMALDVKGFLPAKDAQSLMNVVDSLEGVYDLRPPVTSEGKTVLFVHGAKGSLETFAAFRNDPRFAGYKMRVFLYDYYDPIRASRSLVDVVARERPALIVGHSGGTRVVAYGFGIAPEIFSPVDKILNLAFLPDGSKRADRYGSVADFLADVFGVYGRKVAAFMSKNGDAQKFLEERVFNQASYWQKASFLNAGLNDQHLSDAALSRLVAWSREGKGRVINALPDENGHLKVLEAPGVEYLYQTLQALPTEQRGKDTPNDKAQITAPNGGIDLEKTVVSSVKQGQGVRGAFENETQQHLLEKVPGLFFDIQRITPLSSAEALQLMGS